MQKMAELRDMLCSELDKITKKGEVSMNNLDLIDKLTHSIKSIDTIMAMGGGSYARGRDSMGRYSRDGGSYGSYESNAYYSRDDEIQDLKNRLMRLEK